MGKRAAIYCRISEDRHGTGQKVEDQEADCRALADRLGLTVVEVFTDNDISAMRSTRRGKKRRHWEDLLDAIRAGQVDAVLATEPERVQRETRDLLDYIDACQLHNVPTYTVRGGNFDLSTPDGQAHAKIVTAFKENEAQKAKQRMKAARVHKVSRGQWPGGRRPFGYERDGVTVRKVEADALKWTAAQVLAGVSLNATVAKLNQRGSTTSTGRPWTATELRRVLVRARNAGLIVHLGQVVGKAEWPAIVDEDTWRGLRAMLGDPDRRTNVSTVRRWLLSGLATCGVCGDLVKSFSASAKRRPVRPVYTCRSGKHVIRTAEEVDRFVEEVVIGILTKRGAELLAPDQTGDTAALHLRDAALAARLAELGRLAGEGAIDPGQLVEATAVIRRQREEITAQLAAMSRGSVLAGVADAPDPAKVWAGLDLSRKREIIRVLMTVVIKPAKRGRRPGWRPGEAYFDPATIDLLPKR
jgi:site-specific DNA recombinase